MSAWPPCCSIVSLKSLAVITLACWCRLLFGESTIQAIELHEKDFFAKRLSFHGILIKASETVVDEALIAAYGRLDMLLSNQPVVISNLVSAGAELHIIGRSQVTSDL